MKALRYVIPGFSSQDAANCRWANTVFFCQVDFREAHSLMSLPYLNYLIGGEFRANTVVSAWLASLLHFILHVVCSRTAKQVRGIATSGIVAMVKNIVANGYCAKVHFIGLTMRASSLALKLNEAVAILVFCPLPFPTVIGAAEINTFPELFDKGFFRRASGVSLKIPKWFAYYPPKAHRCLFGDVGFLTATAMTVTVWNFARGMIVHSNVSLSDLLTPRDDSSRRRGNFMRFTRSIIPQVSA